MYGNRYIFLLWVTSFFFLVADNEEETLDVKTTLSEKDDSNVLQQLRKDALLVSNEIKQSHFKLKRCKSYLNRLQIDSAPIDKPQKKDGEIYFVHELVKKTNKTLHYLDHLKDSFQYKMAESRDSNEIELMIRWRNKRDLILELRKDKSSEIDLLESRISELENEELLHTGDIAAKNTLYVEQTDSISSLVSKQRVLRRRRFEINSRINNELLKNNCGWIGTQRYEKSEQNELPFELLYPVSNGIVVSEFGICQHPLEGKILTRNLGLDIQVLEESPVQAVTSGEVHAVYESNTKGRLIVINFGEYRYVYANMGLLLVQEGDSVSAGSTIGYSSKGTLSKIHFELWRGKNVLNPELYFP